MLASLRSLVPITVISRTKLTLHSIEVGQVQRAILTFVGDDIEQLSQRTAQTFILLLVKVVRVIASLAAVCCRSNREKTVSFVALAAIDRNVVDRSVPTRGTT